MVQSLGTPIVQGVGRRSEGKLAEGGPRQHSYQPAICSKCKKVTAQPRHIVFRYVVSLVIVSNRTPVQGVFCSSCARKAALKCSAISALAGWWGIPFGPIFTVVEIYRNAAGGELPPGAEQRLLWLNALSFLSAGNKKLAYGLAQRVRTLEGSDLAGQASNLIDEARKAGFPVESSTLKNPWVGGPLRALPHFALLAVAPLAFFVLPWGVGSVSSSIARPPKRGDQAACTLPPATAQILGGTHPSSSPGNTIEIKNGSNGPAIIKVRHSPSGQLAFSFYVARGETGRVDGIPDGTYNIQYAIGRYLASNCSSLAHVISVQKFAEADTLTTEYQPGEVVTKSLSYTLYEVPLGNVRPQAISIDAFNAN